MKNKLEKIKLAVLIGKGGRLKTIHRCVKKIKNADLALVVSHKKISPGVEWAKEKGIESFYFRLSDWKESRVAYDKELVDILKKKNVNLVVLAGWDLILSGEFLNCFLNKVINIHPSLCPAFPGMDAERKALDYGVKYTGCTLHFVDPGVDTGAIILQRAVEIGPKETIESLQKKIHQKEEEILCEGIKLFCRGKLKIDGNKVLIK